MPRHVRVPALLAAGGLTAAVLLSGCGAPGTTSGASPGTTGSIAPTIAGGSTEAFCARIADLGLAPEDVASETASPGDPTAATRSLVEQIDEIQQELPEDAPPAVSAALTTFANYLRSAAGGRSPDPEAAAALDQAQAEISDYVDRTCDASGSPAPSAS